MELFRYPCLHRKHGRCNVCDPLVLPRWNVFRGDLPPELWQCHVFKWLNRLEQLAVMLTCKRLYSICIRRRPHTDKFRRCIVCDGRIRAYTKKVKNGITFAHRKKLGSVGKIADCGCRMHERCEYFNRWTIYFLGAALVCGVDNDDLWDQAIAQVMQYRIMDPPKSFKLHYNCERCKK